MFFLRHRLDEVDVLAALSVAIDIPIELLFGNQGTATTCLHCLHYDEGFQTHANIYFHLDHVVPLRESTLARDLARILCTDVLFECLDAIGGGYQWWLASAEGAFERVQVVECDDGIDVMQPTVPGGST